MTNPAREPSAGRLRPYVALATIQFEDELAGRPRTVLPRERLLADVWGWADASGTRTVDSHIKGLRRKLGADLIRTVHGVGYALEVQR